MNQHRTAANPEDDKNVLLAEHELDPVIIERPHGDSRFFLTVDHADRLVPQKLGTLGLAEAEFDRHIAYDIGILGVSRHLSKLMDAPMIGQRYSRLVIDCNRKPGVAASIPEVSDGTVIPANQGLTPEARRQREKALFEPYHEAIDRLLHDRVQRQHMPIYLAMHSFTPKMAERGGDRPWHVGLLTHDDRRLAPHLLDGFASDPSLCVGDNDPYRVNPQDDFGLMVHGHERGLLHIGFEIRQDLITSAAGQIEWAERVADCLRQLPLKQLED